MEKTVESKAKGENGTRGSTISWSPTFLNTGTLDYAVARTMCVADGIDYLAVGFNARAQKTLPAPLPLTYNLETDSGISVAVTTSCDLIVRSICSNDSLLTVELRLLHGPHHRVTMQHLSSWKRSTASYPPIITLTILRS